MNNNQFADEEEQSSLIKEIKVDKNQDQNEEEEDIDLTPPQSVKLTSHEYRKIKLKNEVQEIDDTKKYCLLYSLISIVLIFIVILFLGFGYLENSNQIQFTNLIYRSFKDYKTYE